MYNLNRHCKLKEDATQARVENEKKANTALSGSFCEKKASFQFLYKSVYYYLHLNIYLMNEV